MRRKTLAALLAAGAILFFLATGAVAETDFRDYGDLDEFSQLVDELGLAEGAHIPARAAAIPVIHRLWGYE